MKGAIKMNELTKTSESYVGYEYTDVVVNRDMENVFTDAYPSFGWIPDGSAASDFGITTVNLKFKRDRRIRNKAELTRLQRQFESNAREIEKLEQSKTTKASIAAYTIGLIGTAFMAGSVFAFLASMIPLFIVLAIPGFIGWGLAYVSFIKIKANRIKKVTPMIEQQYDAVYDICEKACGLLA
jgi:hypothetical protein